MRKFAAIRNVLFIALVLLPLIFVGVYTFIGAKTDLVTLPKTSTLEGRVYQKFPKITAKNLLEGTFQDNYEKFLSDAVPGKETLILANATAQRASIDLSNTFFNFDATPTFFGATYSVWKGTDVVAENTMSKNSSTDERLSKLADNLSKFMDRHNANYAFYLTDRGLTSEASPVSSLKTSTVNYSYIQEHLLSKISSRCKNLDGSLANIEEYATRRFPTDHHWTIDAAVEAYEKIVTAFEKTPADYSEKVTLYEGKFWGSASRAGLVQPNCNTTIEDVIIDTKGLSLRINGSKAKLSKLSKQFSSKGVTQDTPYDNMYVSCFHTDFARIDITNEYAESDDTLLMVADSFSNNCEKIYSANYAHVIVIDPRYFKKDLGKVLEEEQPADVVFLLSGATVVSEAMGNLFSASS